MKNEFCEELDGHTVTKIQPWPIKLAMKYGVNNVILANLVVITLSLVLILGTALIYKNIFFAEPSQVTEYTPAEKAEAEQALKKYMAS